MKKLLGISLVAALAVSPMMAMADPVYITDGSPAAATDTANTGNNRTTAVEAPYASVDAQASTNIATTSYVKGAYNAAIQAVNKVAADVATLDGNMDDYVEKSAAVAVAEDDQTIHYATETSSTENFVGKNIGHLDAQVYTNTTAIGDANSGLTKRVGDLETNTTVDSLVANKTNYITTSASAADNIETLNAQVVSLTDSVGSLNTDAATKEGVVATIEKATVSGSVTGDVTVYTTWGNDSATDTVALNNGSMTGGTVSLANDKYYEDMSDATGTSYTPAAPSPAPGA